MTGPEHYKAGEEEIAAAVSAGNTYESRTFHATLALAHFTAASAAATALDASRRDGFGWADFVRDVDDWQAAAGAA
jgi:hypothetical protein